MARADIYLTNNTDGPIGIGLLTIKAGKTSPVLGKDVERKASYIDRMIKEGRLSIGSAGKDAEIEAPSVSEVTAPEVGDITPPVEQKSDIAE
ncbi:MAG: hypothetical protein DRN17_05920, partial [Thermoplasmata archaeon]